MAVAKIFSGDRMTSRQRLLAAYRGLEVDRIPFWAKVSNPTWRTSQPKSIGRLDTFGLLDHILADGIFVAPRFVRLVRPRVSVTESLSGDVRTVVTRTPDGDMTESVTHDPYTDSWHPTEFAIKSRRDIARYRWCLENVRTETDPRALADAARLAADIGQRGVLLNSWGTSPLMDMVEHLAGPVNTTYLLSDWPDEMESLLSQMHGVCMLAAEAVARQSPADVVVTVENTSTTLISPAQFRRYCHPCLCDYGRIVEQAGKMHELHMCGHIKSLLPLIDSIPAASIEAFTSPTLGNSRLVDGRTLAAGKTLIGGTNATIWLRPIDEILEYIRGELDACPDHRRVILTTAGVAPPACRAKKFRAAAEWLATYKPKMRPSHVACR